MVLISVLLNNLFSSAYALVHNSTQYSDMCYFLFHLGFAASQRLTGAPPGDVKHVVFGESISVNCIPESTSEAINLKWFGPKEYHPLSGEPNLILSKDNMPAEEGSLYSRYVAPVLS